MSKKIAAVVVAVCGAMSGALVGIFMGILTFTAMTSRLPADDFSAVLLTIVNSLFFAGCWWFLTGYVVKVIIDSRR